MRAINASAFSVSFIVASARCNSLDAALLDGEMDRDSSFEELAETMDMTYGRIIMTKALDCYFRLTAANFDMMPASYYQKA